ncbi:hypothetical protein L210DRAFT_3108774 [Boletus edulis BED1]|uniref:TPR-like protein n=1 Tax=Boletus edulis BED1 TaxID=1328754 RepID=A0AAD4BZN4_BOLED|nr:hypothetical protein L210DRAFT_3108774 [Boletus edulis BED1]
MSRFNHLGDLSDLDGALSRHRDALDLIPQGDPNRPNVLCNLGNLLFLRFKHLGKPSDLEVQPSIMLLTSPPMTTLTNQTVLTLSAKNAVDLTPDGHPDKLRRLGILGLAFKLRFEHVEELSNLEDAISTLKDVVNLTPESHPDKPRDLNNLGDCLRARYDRLGNLSDLEDALSSHRDAAELTPMVTLTSPVVLRPSASPSSLFSSASGS